MTNFFDQSNPPSRSFPFSDKAVNCEGGLNDELNRQKFCMTVGRLLLGRAGTDGLVLSIEGVWGSGKSSALGMIRQFLDTQKQTASSTLSKRTTRRWRLFRWMRRQKRKPPIASENHSPILVEFNPWLVGAADHTIQAFLAQIASEIGQASQSSKAEEAAQRLIAYAQLLEPLKWIPGAEPWTSIVKNVAESTGRAVHNVSELHKLNIGQQRDALKCALLDLGVDIIIFIDDIDRLPPGEVFEIVRAIQAISDLPRCSFVIALDPLYTERALRAAANFDSPGQYLDKIIHLRLSLPHINKSDLAKYFEKRLQQILSTFQQERIQAEEKRLAQVWQLAIKPLIQTPRDAIRIINRFLYVEQNCGREVCWGDLLGLQAVAIMLPEVYRHIMQNPGAYTGVDMADTYQRVSCQEHVDQFSSERTQALASLADRTKIQAERLLEELFPLLRSYSYDKLSQKDFSLSRRVAASDRLRIALTYDLPSDEVSLEEIESFCYTPAVRDAVIDQILTRDLLDHFLEAVLQKIEPARVVDSHELVFYLGKLVEKKQVNSNFQGFRSLFRMSMIDKIILLAENVLKLSADHADDLTRLEIYVSDTSILTLGTHLLARRLAKREERKRQSEPEADKNLLQASAEPVLQHWLDTSMRTLCDQSFLQIADKWIVIRVLLSLKEGRDKLPELLQPYLDSDEKFDAIADVFVSNQAESAEGMSVTCSEELLSMLGDPEAIRSKAANRLRDLSIQSSMRLCAIYRSIVHGKKMYIEVSAETQEWDE